MLTQHYLSFLVIFWGDYRFTVLQLLSLTKWLFIQISIIHDNISSQVAGRVLANGWTHLSSITVCVHVFIISVIPKFTIVTYDIKYHMTLNIIFSVVFLHRKFNLFPIWTSGSKHAQGYNRMPSCIMVLTPLGLQLGACAPWAKKND